MLPANEVFEMSFDEVLLAVAAAGDEVIPPAQRRAILASAERATEEDPTQPLWWVRRAHLEAALAAWKPRLEAAGIAVALDAESAQPLGVVGDAEQLQQIFANLLLNALQAMPGGGRIEIEISGRDGQTQVSFADTGPGIPPEHLQRVFEPFFTTKEVGQGTGLGLAISYGIAQAHGGRLRAQNRPQGGAQFVLELPCRPAVRSAESPP